MNNLITVDINAILNNISQVKKVNKKIIFVVKGEVYGFGYKIIPFLDSYIYKYAVSSILEAKILQLYTKKKILILSPVEMTNIVDDKQLIYSISSIEQLNIYKSLDFKELNIAIKINTGLNRYGIEISEIKDFLSILCNKKFITTDIYTHLATSTSSKEFEYVQKQYKNYSIVLNEIKNTINLENVDTHFTDSATLLRIKINQKVNSIRTGMTILGLDPISDIKKKQFPLSFAYKFKSIILDKHLVSKNNYYGYEKKAKNKMFTCTIGIGYCDGIRKSWIGNNVIKSEYGDLKLLDVSMNSSIIQVSEEIYQKIQRLKSEVNIISSQEDLNQLAKLASSSIEDILCGFFSRNSCIDYKE